jgi:hypothetical protein
VRALQQALTLTPSGTGGGIPELDPDVPKDLAFFERLRGWLQAFPPAARDFDYQRHFEPLGVFAAQSPYTDADSERAAALRAGLAAGREHMEQALKLGLARGRMAGA